MNKDKERNDKHVCRALITPSTDESYDFEAVAVPAENGQMRYSYENDEYFNQILMVGSENVDTARLDSGLPLFDNHPYDNSAENVLGITTAFSFDDRGLVVRCKFGARADEALRADVKNGIVKTVSIEGEIQNYNVVREYGLIPRYEAEKWMPLSLSFAPVPNDISAQIEVKRAIQKQITPQENKKTNYQKLTSKF